MSRTIYLDKHVRNQTAKDFEDLQSYVNFNKVNIEHAKIDSKLEFRKIKTIYVIDFQELYSYLFKSDFEDNPNFTADDYAAIELFNDIDVYFTFLHGTWFELISFISNNYKEITIKFTKTLNSLFSRKETIENFNQHEDYILQIKESILEEASISNALTKLLKILNSEYFIKINDIINKDYHINFDLYKQIKQIIESFNSERSFQSNAVDISNILSTISLNQYFEERNNIGDSLSYHFILLTHTPTLFGIHNAIFNLTKNIYPDLDAPIIRSPVNLLYSKVIIRKHPKLEDRFRLLQDISKKVFYANSELEKNYYLGDSTTNILYTNSDVIFKKLEIKEIDITKIGYDSIYSLLKDETINDVVKNLINLTYNGRMIIELPLIQGNEKYDFNITSTIRLRALLSIVYNKIFDNINNNKFATLNSQLIMDKMNITTSLLHNKKYGLSVRVFRNENNEEILKSNHFLEKKYHSFTWKFGISSKHFLEVLYSFINSYTDNIENKNKELYYELFEIEGIINIINYNADYVFNKEIISFKHFNSYRFNTPDFSIIYNNNLSGRGEASIGFICNELIMDLLEELFLKLSYNIELKFLLNIVTNWEMENV